MDCLINVVYCDCVGDDVCLHHHRRQWDVTFNLQGLNVSERGDPVTVGVSLHPVHQNLEVVIVTVDSQL